MPERDPKPELELPLIVVGLLGINAGIALGLSAIINPEKISNLFCCPGIILLVLGSANLLKLISPQE